MRKENPVQLEIFSLDNTDLKNQRQSKTFLNYIWNYEKIILTVIAFLVISIASFSLGFERGKRIASKTGLISNIASSKEQIQGSTKVLPVPVKEPAVVTLASSKPIMITQGFQKNYTVQVATYKSKTYAQKEAQVLKNKGFQPLVFPKEKYTQLCVGQFSNKDEAQTSLKELRKRYGDCFIRRL